MLIREELRELCAFLYIHERRNQPPNATGAPLPPLIFDTPFGTGFLIDEIDEPVIHTYLVTARHVIDGSRTRGDLSVRFNTNDGKHFDWYPEIGKWYCHESNDVAAILLYDTKLPLNLHLRYVPMRFFATDEYLREHEVGTGDTVFTIGCQLKSPGKERNEPVARFGRIARMPGEILSLAMPDFGEIKTPAYLIHCSVPSVTSGSPVFYYTEKNGKIDDLALLGLLFGIIPEPELDKPLEYIVDAALSVAIPADAIRYLLNKPDVAKERKEITERAKGIPIGIPLSGNSFAKGGENVQ